MEQLQSHIWLTASSSMGKYFRISSFIRKPFLIYDFATVPLWISLYMRKIFFSFLSVQLLTEVHLYHRCTFSCNLNFSYSAIKVDRTFCFVSLLWNVHSFVLKYEMTGLSRPTEAERRANSPAPVDSSPTTRYATMFRTRWHCSNAHGSMDGF